MSLFLISTNQCHLATYYQVPDGLNLLNPPAVSNRKFCCSLNQSSSTPVYTWNPLKTFGLIGKTLLLEGSRLKNKVFPGSNSFLQANAFLLTLFSPLATNSVMTLVSGLKLPSTALMCRFVKGFVFSIHLSQNS